MSEVAWWAHREVAPDVKKLLQEFHADTLHKRAIAPEDSPVLIQREDGSWDRVDEGGFLVSYENLDKADVIEVLPISIVDTEVDEDL
ncbi:hypothetical protein [Nocardia arthritidis]|uniref:Uncharacterized protein n=1 Tax=Nocardia arthritidis TaxID=228602 RepID=A0A6G9YTL2_9NOCA|nr:hypothetical protein [Nocardia arthritidis]QIS16480.1 hypothetical protein F5544_43375 [Nocardia arthritidis]